jgi:hypothetical protein
MLGDCMLQNNIATRHLIQVLHDQICYLLRTVQIKISLRYCLTTLRVFIGQSFGQSDKPCVHLKHYLLV